MVVDFTIENANNHIKSTEVNDKYYPKYNFAAPVGWINDPNGLVVYKDELHLFYQYYPYDSVHGKMHWGHAKTKDGLNWEHLDVALAPDKEYDIDGVFSGSAIEKDGKLYIMYSGNIEYEPEKIKQTQNIAISEDGIHFEKYENNPVIDHNDVPEGTSKYDFRDPKVFKKEDTYYAVIGSKTEEDKGQVLLYESENLLDWSFTSIILSPNKYLGEMVECPDLILFEERDIFLLSAMNYTDEETGEFFPHISWIVEGKMDWSNYTFETQSIRKMDDGFDFYAPQTALVSENPNEYVAIAWQQAWNRTLPSHEEGHNWAGQMTLPRKLSIVDGEFIHEPFPSILNHLEILKTITPDDLDNSQIFSFNGDVIKLIIEPYQVVELTLKNTENENVYLKLDHQKNELRFSRKNTKPIRGHNDRLFDEKNCSISMNDEIWEVLLFIDTSSIQVFINRSFSFTSTFYVDKPLTTLKLGKKKAFKTLSIGKLPNKMKGKKIGE